MRVPIHVSGVSLDKSTISLTTAGDTSQLTATVTPSNAENKKVTWSSSNTSVATVSSTGLVTCVTPGSCTITVTTEDGGYTANCSVINMIHVTGVTLNTNSLTFSTVGQTQQLTATVLPSNATNKNVTWSSNNTSVATVSSTGLVTCKGNGTAIITVTTQDGGYTARCNIYTLITTSGIYHNSSLGLISLSSNGSNWITISDKNQGASIVYNYGDTMSQYNCGNYFQWGNNYAFPFNGNISTTPTSVNTTGYGPGNYYSSSLYITGTGSGDEIYEPKNYNLWGETTNTNEARRGPCNSGFHVPSNEDFANLNSIMNALGFTNGSDYSLYLKMPFAGARGDNGSVDVRGERGVYLSSYCKYSNQYYSTGYTLGIISSGVRNQYFYQYGASIRPFKNDIIQPDSSWTKLY